MLDGAWYFNRLFGKCTSGSIVFCAKSGKGFKRSAMFDLAKPNGLADAIKYATGKKEIYVKFNAFDGDAILERQKRGEHGIGQEREITALVCFAIDIDVDSKDGKYNNRDDIVFALQNLLPVEYSLLVGSDGPNKGLHVYWIFEVPIDDMADMADIKKFQAISHRFYDELKKVLVVDPTFGLERILRPVGSVRNSGNEVTLIDDTCKSYTLDDLTFPGWEKYMPAPVTSSRSTAREDNDKLVARYLNEVLGLKDIYDVLNHFKWTSVDRDDYYIRPGSTSDSKTGQIYEQDGVVGITLKSTVIGALNNVPIPKPSNPWCTYDRLWLLLTYGCEDSASEHMAWIAAAKLAYKEINAKDPGWEFDVWDGVLPSVPEPPLTNYYESPYTDEKGALRVIVKPKSAQTLMVQLRKIFGDWPKCLRGKLFVEGKTPKEILPIASADELFAWMMKRHKVLWRGDGKDGFVTKSEFFKQVLQSASRIAGIEKAPHFVRRTDRHYLCRDLEIGDGSELKKLIDLTRLCSEEDTQLFIAMMMTILWSGPFGERPCFLIRARGEVDKIIGSGKTTVSMAPSKLGGGGEVNHISIMDGTTFENVTTWMVQDEQGKRVVLIDNLKGSRLGGQDIEQLITTPKIGGKHLYVGYGERDNDFCWILNGNLNMFSKDMAQRIIPINIFPPDKYSVKINRALEKIDYAKVADDLYAIYCRPERDLEHLSRRPVWDTEILSKLENPDDLALQIRFSRESLDGGCQDEQEIIQAIEGKLRDAINLYPKNDSKRSELETAFTQGKIFIPTRMVLHWLKSEGVIVRDAKELKALVERTGLLRLVRCTDTALRGYVWVGANLGPEPKLVSHLRDMTVSGLI